MDPSKMENVTLTMDMQDGEPKIPYSMDEDLDDNGMLKLNDRDGRYFPIAIVGIGLRMPSAKNVAEFEDVLVNEKCGIVDIPQDRWHFEDFYHKEPSIKGHYIIPKIGFCDGYYDFDPGYFNISPREAVKIDPQQRQVLEIADEAVQDAGYTKETIPKDTGVYVGMGIIDFPGVYVENKHMYSGHNTAGFSHACAANRVSHHYGLTGPSIALDTACAASLTAIHVACMSLWNKENSAALCGATSNVYSPETTVAFSHMSVLSATGNSAPFDESNDGYVRSEGTSMLLIKPLAHAVRDGDHVYCVIRGTTSAHNGNSNSLTLPSAEAQEVLIRRCYKQYGIPMEKVEFVEAHGTGTPVGDPLEAKALGRTFGFARKQTPGMGPLPIQSAKSNFGHLEVAAGMVQVVKTALMLEKRTFYKQLNWTSVNPRIDLDDLNLYIPVEKVPYTKNEKFVIGVNTFGFGGSLVHSIYEEYRPKIKAIDDVKLAGWSFGNSTNKGKKIAIPLSAKVDAAMKNTVEKWLKWENEADAQTVVGWLSTRREHHREKRLVILSDSGADFRVKLQKWLNNEEDCDIINGSKPALYQKPTICMIYPGRGQQYSNMGRNLYQNSPVFRNAVNECDVLFKNLSGYSALEQYHIFTQTDKEEVEPAAYKPAIVFLQVGLTKLLASWGIKPDTVMGLGLGEQVAAYAAGAMTLSEVIAFMYIRMSAPPKEEFMKQLSLVLNSPTATSAKFFSTVTGKEYNEPLDAEYWWKSVVSDTRPTSAIDAVLKHNSDVVFIEVAASSCVEYASGNDNLSIEHLTCGERNMDDWMQVQRMMAELHVSGYPVSWADITEHCSTYAPIPLYGWDDKEYRVESHEYTGRRMGLIDRSFRNMGGQINMEFFCYLRDYCLHDELIFPAAAYIEYFSEYDDSKTTALKDIKIHKNMKVLPLTTEGYIQTVKLDVRRNKSHLSAISEDKQIMAEATLAKAKSVSVQPQLDLESVKNKCPGITEGSVIYKKFADKGLTYGTFFKLIQHVHVGDMEAFAICSAPHSRMRFERIETIVLDNAFQAAIGVFAGNQPLYMPVSIGRLQTYVEKVPAVTEFSVHIVLKDWNLQHIVCDLTICDNDGNIWLTVTDFIAESTAEHVTSLDLNKCCYVSKMQSSQADMPSITDLELMLAKSETTDSEKAANTLQILKPLISSLTREATADVQDSSVSVKQLTLAGLHPNSMSSEALSEEILDAYPQLSTEVNHMKSIATELMNPQPNNKYTEEVLTFMKESNIMCELIAPYLEAITSTVHQALDQKNVLRVCSLGDERGLITKLIVQSLQDEIESAKVTFTHAGSNNEVFKEINDYLSDLPVIQFEVLDDANNKSQGSFDLLIVSDLLGQPLVPITKMSNLLTNDGLIVLLRNTGSSFFTDFLSLTADIGCAIDSTTLTEAGLVNVKELSCSGPPSITALVGQKVASKSQTPEGPFLIIHSNMSDLAEDLRTKLAGDIQISSITDFISQGACRCEKNLTIVYLIGNQPSLKDTVDVIEILLTCDAGTVKALYGFTNTSMEAAACTGLLRAMNNSKAFPIYTVDSDSTSDALNKCVLSTLGQLQPTQRETQKDSNKVLVPRITRYDISPNNKIDTWEMNLVQNAGEPTANYSEIQMSTLELKQVKVSIKSLSVNDNSKDAVIGFTGIVEYTGSGVDAFRIGDAVMGLGKMPLRSHIILDSRNVQRKPTELSWAEAADSMLSYSTVYNALVTQANIKHGETVLIHTAEGGLSQAAANIAKMKGAKVIFTYDDNQDYMELVRNLGLISLANPYKSGFQNDIMNITNNNGVDVVLQVTTDKLPDTFDNVLAYGARICKVGSTRATVSSLPNARYSSLHLSSYMKRSEKRVYNIARQVAEYLYDGLLKPINTEHSHISNAATELQLLSERHSSQSVVLEIPDDYSPSHIQTLSFSLREDATYLITDGHSLLGVETARWLVNNGARHVAMVSSQEQSFFSKATQKYMESVGARVYNFKTDIVDIENITNMISKLLKQGAPPLKGIFNFEGYVSVQNAEDMNEISELVTKQLTGLQAMDKATADLDLDYFIIITSANTAWGNNSHPAQSAAGAAIDVFSKQRKATLCLQLGQIRGVEDRSLRPEMEQTAEDCGSLSLHVHEYLQVIGNLLQRDDLPATVTITNQDWDKTLKQTYDGCLRFSHLCVDNGLQNSAGGEDAHEKLIQTCRDYIGDLTGSDPAIIQSDHPMTEYGVDSLMSQDIVAWAQKAFKVTLLQADVFGGITIDQLLARI